MAGEYNVDIIREMRAVAYQREDLVDQIELSWADDEAFGASPAGEVTTPTEEDDECEE